ncbi:hypothetical protein ACJ7K1_04350 [Paenibacillus elgii]
MFCQGLAFPLSLIAPVCGNIPVSKNIPATISSGEQKTYLYITEALKTSAATAATEATAAKAAETAATKAAETAEATATETETGEEA